MKGWDKHQDVFFALLRAGLWEQGVWLAFFEPIDYESLYELADEQSVVGLIAAGLEYAADTKVLKKDALPFLKRVFGLESRNTLMNEFIGDMVRRMREAGIFTLLVKGQGVAQCYSRPLWRSSGDIDYFLDQENYTKAKAFLTPLASHVNGEDSSRLHLGMSIDSWTVELHGTMRTEISSRVDSVIDAVQRDIFQKGSVRIWQNSNVDIYLPDPTNDAIIVFTHFIHHFYVGGIGLRQICDWCRLLWTYKKSIDNDLLAERLKEMGLMTEWKTFGTFAVEWLGMQEDAMPFYSNDTQFKRKARRICTLVFESGNLGHNKDTSYRSRYSKVVGGIITFLRRFGEFLRVTTIFPCNAPTFFVSYILGRIRHLYNG